MPTKRAAVKPPPRDPPPDRGLEKAHGSFRDGNYGAAIAVINQILSRVPEHTDALILVSQCHSLLGHYDQAVAFDRKAVDAHPDNPQAWMTLAFDLANLGDMEAAEEACAESEEYREEAKSQPEFAPLLEDPRFLRIVEGAKESDDPYAEWMRSK